MPSPRFALLIAIVISAAGLTIGLGSSVVGNAPATFLPVGSLPVVAVLLLGAVVALWTLGR